MRDTATTDGLATMHFDHETWDHWVDFRPDNTAATRAEVLKAIEVEGLFMLDDECDPDLLADGSFRHYLGYVEVAECP